MKIDVLTMLNGRIIINSHAKQGVSLEDVLEIAESEVYDGYADYARVTVDGEIYAEYEA